MQTCTCTDISHELLACGVCLHSAFKKQNVVHFVLLTNARSAGAGAELSAASVLASRDGQPITFEGPG